MLVTYYDCYQVLSKVYQKGSFIKQAISSTQIEPLGKARVIKICYGVLDKDVTLDYIISSLCSKPPKTTVKILIKIGLYSIKYLETPPHLVTDNLVSLCKKLGKTGVSGFLNAILRRFCREGIDLPSGNKVKDLSVRFSCPEFIVKKLVLGYGLETAIKILSYDEDKTFIRFNDNQNGEEYLKSNAVEYQKTPFSDTFEVKKFTLNEDFYSGVYTFQSVGSRAICSVVTGGEKLLDCCSAPGGKAVKLSEIFDSVTACDIHEHRVELIKSYAKRMGKSNVTAILRDATESCEDFLNSFDTVLCDAPCSGTGVIKDNPDIKLNRTETAVSALSELQLKILSNVSSYVKNGGELIYSTCSVLTEENDGVIEKFLSKNDNFKVVETKNALNHLKTEFGLQFLPHISQGAGFYLCKLKKL
ncbi:MAG: 16S rRNA (cytosine(967)-C(5))-methyltransferase RsmB [Clostridia bacterium]|nr:16S rRNA (cytosine(967)-C(5))-methyltransferase RsmB [Clostridia bacterium]